MDKTSTGENRQKERIQRNVERLRAALLQIEHGATEFLRAAETDDADRARPARHRLLTALKDAHDATVIISDAWGLP